MSVYQLGLYEKAMPSELNWTEKLITAHEAGFDYMEISIDETDEKQARLDWTDVKRQELARAIRVTGVPIRSMCLSGHRKYPLGSHDPAVRTRSLEMMDKAIELCDNLGIRIIQLAGYDVYYEDSDASTRQHFAGNLAACVEKAAAKGILLGFETMETPFMASADTQCQHKFAAQYYRISSGVAVVPGFARLSKRNTGAWLFDLRHRFWTDIRQCDKFVPPGICSRSFHGGGQCQ